MVTVEKNVRLLVKKELVTVNKEAQSQAVQMAAQAIRLAAMICKLERSQQRWKRKAGKSA